jgi:hypothetical protein
MRSRKGHRQPRFRVTSIQLSAAPKERSAKDAPTCMYLHLLICLSTYPHGKIRVLSHSICVSSASLPPSNNQLISTISPSEFCKQSASPTVNTRQIWSGDVIGQRQPLVETVSLARELQIQVPNQIAWLQPHLSTSKRWPRRQDGPTVYHWRDNVGKSEKKLCGPSIAKRPGPLETRDTHHETAQTDSPAASLSFARSYRKKSISTALTPVASGCCLRISRRMSSTALRRVSPCPMIHHIATAL